MKRTLLVDTNRAAYPIYQSLRAQGHDVWVVGGKPTETLAKLAHNYVQLDYSDTEKLSAFVDEKKFDFIVPGCTDLSYEVCAKINRGRFPGIDTPEATETINRKCMFREMATELNIPVPRVLSMEEVATSPAVIIKPVDSFSGRGMSVLTSPSLETLRSAHENACSASRSRRAIFEEYITGQLYSHSAFIRNGKISTDVIVQEDSIATPFTVDTSRVATNFCQRTLETIRKDINRMVSHLKLCDGLMHTQFIAGKDQYWIIEITRRCPGDIYSLLIQFSTGTPYAANYAAPFIGSSDCKPAAHTHNEYIIRHTVTSRQGISLWGFRFSQPVDIRLFVPLATAGDFIEPSPYGRAGIFFFSTTSESGQEALYQQLLANKLFSLNTEPTKRTSS